MIKIAMMVVMRKTVKTLHVNHGSSSVRMIVVFLLTGDVIPRMTVETNLMKSIVVSIIFLPLFNSKIIFYYLTMTKDNTGADGNVFGICLSVFIFPSTI